MSKFKVGNKVKVMNPNELCKSDTHVIEYRWYDRWYDIEVTVNEVITSTTSNDVSYFVAENQYIWRESMLKMSSQYEPLDEDLFTL